MHTHRQLRNLGLPLGLPTFVAVCLLAAGCSGSEVSVSEAPPDEEQQALIDVWTDELFREGDRTITVARARCVATGGVRVLGTELADTVITQDLSVNGSMGVEFLPVEADQFAEVIIDCQESDDVWRELALELSPFSAPGDHDCFVDELDTVRYTSFDLQAKADQAEQIALQAAANCGLI